MRKEIARQRRHNRVRARVSGTAIRPRVVVFRSLTSTYAQAIDDTNGTVLAQASDQKGDRKGTRTARALEIGKQVGLSLMSKEVKKAAFDRRGYKYHGRVKAVAEGLRAAGLDV